MTRRKLCFTGLGVVAILLAASAAALLYVRETPRYSLYLLKRALVSGSLDEVARYADLDAIADSLAEEITKGLRKDSTPGRGGVKDRKREFLDGIAPSLARNLREQVRHQLRQYLGDAEVRDAVDRTSIWLFRIRDDGTKAYVSYKEKDRLVLAKAADGYWKVVAVSLR